MLKDMPRPMRALSATSFAILAGAGLSKAVREMKAVREDEAATDDQRVEAIATVVGSSLVLALSVFNIGYQLKKK